MPGPYTAEFGAIHDTRCGTGFIFTVDPPRFAESVANTLNAAVLAAAEKDKPRDLGAELRELIAAGLGFSTAVRAFADDQAAKEPGLAPYWQKADDESYVREGEVEIDSQGTDGAGFVSKGDDDGAYVLGWVWVANSTAGIEDPEAAAERAEEAKEAGYTVKSASADHWLSYNPEGLDFSPNKGFPTEAAAWAACFRDLENEEG